ncbi:nucleotidyl transferase AbiEii/AbiGii toxin family protein [Achromobacter xylosoxidans]|uniref:nucleotidyl transferase AbiEii/AbiGii toxin family protein n=1 Tax=Alcaligenes xylosoxydans xylosoxydans TaxID=85698 RepID=UPI0009F53126|nr:nucleotidyl transferase AbiEii/AbiGii toxin family protein [Achromobacter xylosoxidans]
MKTFNPRMDVLPAAQQALWQSFAPAATLGYTLYGGTAIALQLGHRDSVDFDFFTDKQLNREQLYETFTFLPKALVRQDRPNTLEVEVAVPGQPDAVKVSFFGGIDVGRVGEPLVTQDGMLQVASLEDLMAMKLKVLMQRVEAKDYRDIAALVNAGIDLPRGLASARAMWPAQFQPSECLKALVYFKDGDLDTLTAQEKQTLVDAASAVRALPQVELVGEALAVPQPTPELRPAPAPKRPRP